MDHHPNRREVLAAGAAGLGLGYTGSLAIGVNPS